MDIQPQDRGCLETLLSLFFGMVLLIAMIIMFV
jgi:hypothetical protein